jgi:hypothetical protein
MRFSEMSGIPESNWRPNLGKVMYYHYTNPAFTRRSFNEGGLMQSIPAVELDFLRHLQLALGMKRLIYLSTQPPKPWFSPYFGHHYQFR